MWTLQANIDEANTKLRDRHVTLYSESVPVKMAARFFRRGLDQLKSKEFRDYLCR